MVFSARADDRAQEAARQLAGLFMQSCVRFAGDSAGLRHWIASVKLPALPPQGQQAFLHGRPGTAYDATNPAGKFVVISGDDGSCSAVAQSADPAALIAALTQFTGEARIALQPTGEHEDPQERALHWREYRGTKGARSWSIAAGTVAGAPAGQAMLTAASPAR